MHWLFRREAIRRPFVFICAVALAGPLVVILEVLALVALLSGDPLGIFDPRSLQILGFLLFYGYGFGLVPALLAGLVLLWRRRISILDGLLVSVSACAVIYYLVQAGRRIPDLYNLPLQLLAITLIVSPGALAAGFLARYWGAFRSPSATAAPV